MPVSKVLGLDGVLRFMPLLFPWGTLNFQIAHLEMLNILAALRVWQSQWSNMKVEIACDNLAVVQVLTSGRTRDLTLAAIARNIQFQAALMNISLKFTHIPGKVNVLADLLSRWQTTPHAQQTLAQLLPNHIWVPISENYLFIEWAI